MTGIACYDNHYARCAVPMQAASYLGKAEQLLKWSSDLRGLQMPAQLFSQSQDRTASSASASTSSPTADTQRCVSSCDIRISNSAVLGDFGLFICQYIVNNGFWIMKRDKKEKRFRHTVRLTIACFLRDAVPMKAGILASAGR
jgi:hypothetical protein